MGENAGPGAVPWRTAWQEALYGEGGFYRSGAGPAGHFTTATHGPPGRALAGALLAWADRLGCDAVVDVGAGRGELLAHLRVLDPDRPLCGVDVVPRPTGLPEDVEWLVSPGGAALPDGLAPRDALVVAHEWLDVVPCEVGEVDDEGVLRVVLVDPGSGEEQLGGPVDGADLEWCQRFWPSVTGPGASPGDRVEVGRPRDEAWEALLSRMTGGVALAVDYGHRLGERPPAGSLTAYRDGVAVAPRPDGSCDLTAHVAVDTLRHDELLTQREALRRVGLTGHTPDHALARSDPAGYLRALGESSAEATLVARGGFGDFWWVLARP